MPRFSGIHARTVMMRTAFLAAVCARKSRIRPRRIARPV
jgi:hypothetical protein